MSVSVVSKGDIVWILGRILLTLWVISHRWWEGGGLTHVKKFKYLIPSYRVASLLIEIKSNLNETDGNCKEILSTITRELEKEKNKKKKQMKWNDILVQTLEHA